MENFTKSQKTEKWNYLFENIVQFREFSELYAKYQYNV